MDNFLANARALDESDPLLKFRNEFHFPVNTQGKDQIYLCGNSLGLQSKSVRAEIENVLMTWQEKGVEGHFHGNPSWIDYISPIKRHMSAIVGALPDEIAIMNTLTVNLHMLMISFYRPTKSRFKIMIESDAFPSDRYAVESQIRFHGYEPDDALILLKPRVGKYLVELDDVKESIKNNGDSIALIMIGGINYYTGQLFDLEEITKCGHSAGCVVGFDLAHAAGNVLLKLHDWNVDFAAWCNYKYINSGPGSIASAFVHQNHHRKDLPRLEGWWGNKLDNRFLMRNRFDASVGAEAWVQSTPPTLAIAPIKASMEIFSAAGGIQKLVQKSRDLTGFLETELLKLETSRIEIISPTDPTKRGSQLSIRIIDADKTLFQGITNHNVIVDWREPDVIRVAPTALYNSYEDVYHFVTRLKEILV